MKFLKSSELKSYREKILQNQNYTDPITLEVLTLENSTQDHSHEFGNLRGSLERSCNQFEGKVNSAYIRFLKHKNLNITLPNILRNLANYLERNYENSPKHPLHFLKLSRKFNSLNKKDQLDILCGDKRNKLFRNDENLKTKAQRLKAYKKLITNESTI